MDGSLDTMVESSADLLEAPVTWSDFSWQMTDEDNLDSIQGFLASEESETASDLGPDVLSMSSTITNWGHSPFRAHQTGAARIRPLSETSLPSGPVLPVSENSRTGGSSTSCQCLRTLAQLLEDTGITMNRSDNAVDTLLKCIGCGVRVYGESLACPSCNVCSNSKILIVTIAKHLSDAAASLVKKLSLYNNKPEDAGKAFDSEIRFGCYNIETPKMRLSFFCLVVKYHLAELHILLGHIKGRMDFKGGAEEQPKDAEDDVYKCCSTIQRLLDSLPAFSPQIN